MADRQLPFHFDSLEEYYAWKAETKKTTPKGYEAKETKKTSTRKKNVTQTKQGVK